MEEKELPLEVIKRKLEFDKQHRAQKFVKYLEDGAKEFNCDIIVLPQINQEGRIVAVMQIVARD